MAIKRTSPTVLSLRSGTNLILGTIAALMLFVGSGLISYFNTRTLNRNARLIAQTHEILLALDDVLSLAKDAETGQRGFLITGDEKYLAPYSAALIRIDARVFDLEQLTRESQDQQARIGPLKTAIDIKLRELGESIEVRRIQGFESAKAIVITDRGKAAMDAIRAEILDMHSAELHSPQRTNHGDG